MPIGILLVDDNELDRLLVRRLLTRAYIVRELLFNVVKHAGVQTARLRLEACTGDYAIVVEDEGCGFDVEARGSDSESEASGFGLYSVQKRLELVGGRLEIESEPGDGCRITVYAPYEVG